MSILTESYLPAFHFQILSSFSCCRHFSYSSFIFLISPIIDTLLSFFLMIYKSASIILLFQMHPQNDVLTVNPSIVENSSINLSSVFSLIYFLPQTIFFSFLITVITLTLIQINFSCPSGGRLFLTQEGFLCSGYISAFLWLLHPGLKCTSI